MEKRRSTRMRCRRHAWTRLLRNSLLVRGLSAPVRSALHSEMAPREVAIALPEDALDLIDGDPIHFSHLLIGHSIATPHADAREVRLRNLRRRLPLQVDLTFVSSL